MLFIAVAVSALSLNAQTVYVPNGTSGIGGSLNGNVGVGTSSPQYKLDVIGDIQMEGKLGRYMSDASTYDGKALSNYSLGWFGDSWFLYGPTLWQSAWGGMKYFTNGTPRLAITNGGNVGIGTTAPAKALDVAGSIYLFPGRNGDPTLKFNNQGWARIGGSSSSGLAIWGTGNAETDDNPAMFVASGSVGIGTTAPDQKLTVKGKIHAEEVIVDLNVPLADYVFGKDYELMPLHQVDQYVQENSHLPDMPSATEVKEKGMGVGEMQNKMLQKIEELTLYVIQQDKRIKALEEENQRLKK